MIKLLVAVFETEGAAFDGLTALKRLHHDGDITLYASSVLAKEKAGQVSVKQAVDNGPVATTTGMLSGSLIGLLAGPAGLAVGLAAGGLTGLLFDIYAAGVDATFLDDVSKALRPGNFAVVAEIDEAWTTPVDHRLHELGGLVFRRVKSEAADDQIARESAAFSADLRSLQEELRSATAEQKVAIEKNIKAVKAELGAMHDQASSRIDKAKSEVDARIKMLHSQAMLATGRAKARIDERIAAVKLDFDTRSKKLNQAWALTRDAFSA